MMLLRRLPLAARALAPTSRPMSSGIFTGGKARAPLPSVLPTVNLFQFMRETGKWGEVADKVALRCSTEDFRPITYKELEGRVSATAHALRGIGFQKGDVMNVHLHNCQQYVVTFLACAQLGGVASTSNPAYVAAELANQHVDSGSKFVLSSKAYEAVVTAAAAESGLSDKVFWVEDSGCFANLKATDEPPPEPDQPIDVMKDLLTLPYSSGTTGKPKGVMLTQRNLTVNILQCMEASAVTRDDTLIGVLPLCASAGRDSAASFLLGSLPAHRCLHAHPDVAGSMLSPRRPHLRNDGPHVLCARAAVGACADEQVRAHSFPRRDEQVRGERRLLGAAHYPLPGQAPDGQAVRSVEAPVDHVGRGAS